MEMHLAPKIFLFKIKWLIAEGGVKMKTGGAFSSRNIHFQKL